MTHSGLYWFVRPDHARELAKEGWIRLGWMRRGQATPNNDSVIMFKPKANGGENGKRSPGPKVQPV